MVHPFYRCPVRSDSLDTFTPEHSEVIHLFEIGAGMALGAMVCARPSDMLRVGFHAAKTSSSDPSHMFSPVTLNRDSDHAYVMFSDPTLTLAPQKLALSWWLGTPEIDPDDWMENIVRRVADACGATWLLIEGSSGGGFTALRFAARFHYAVAVPKVPQTDLFRYQPGPLDATLEIAWPGWDRDRAQAEAERRFRIAPLYNDPVHGPLVHYVQNAGDTVHIRDHLHPFLTELGSEPHVFSALNGRISISRPFVGTGHLPIPRAYWAAENAFALARLQRLRPAPDPVDR
jgi:hypothetical protein